MLPVIVLVPNCSPLPNSIPHTHTHSSLRMHWYLRRVLVFACVRVCIRNVLVPNTTVSWQGVARQMGEAMGVREEIDLMARATHFTVVKVYTCLCILVRMMLYAPSPPRSLSLSLTLALCLSHFITCCARVCVCSGILRAY